MIYRRVYVDVLHVMNYELVSNEEQKFGLSSENRYR
jgi:hypothetical protein